MYTTPVCMLLKLEIYSAEVGDLVNLTHLNASHVMCDNYATIYVDQ